VGWGVDLLANGVWQASPVVFGCCRGCAWHWTVIRQPVPVLRVPARALCVAVTSTDRRTGALLLMLLLPPLAVHLGWPDRLHS